MKIGYIVGSLSSQSLNRGLSKVLESVVPDGVEFFEIPIKELPVYNRDRDADYPQVALELKAAIEGADGIVLITPEHNRSIPAALKNVLDIASRPAGRSVWTGKKAALITASPGTYGGISCGLHVRQILQSLGVSVLVAPELYLSRVTEALDAEGKVADARTQTALKKWVQALDNWLVG